MELLLEERHCRILQLEMRLEMLHSESEFGPLSLSPLLCSSIKEMWPCGSGGREASRARCCCHAVETSSTVANEDRGGGGRLFFKQR